MRWTIAQLLLATLFVAVALAVGRYLPWPELAWQASFRFPQSASEVAMLVGLTWVALVAAVSFWLWPRTAIPWLVLAGGALGAILGTPAVTTCGRQWITCVVDWSLGSCLFATGGMALFTGAASLLQAIALAVVNFDW